MIVYRVDISFMNDARSFLKGYFRCTVTSPPRCNFNVVVKLVLSLKCYTPVNKHMNDDPNVTMIVWSHNIHRLLKIYITYILFFAVLSVAHVMPLGNNIATGADYMSSDFFVFFYKCEKTHPLVLRQDGDS